MLSFILVAILATAPYNGGQWDQPYNAYCGRQLTGADVFTGKSPEDARLDAVRTYFYNPDGTQNHYEVVFEENGETCMNWHETDDRHKDEKTYVKDSQTGEWKLTSRDYQVNGDFGPLEVERWQYYKATGQSATMAKTTSVYDSQNRPIETITYGMDYTTSPELKPKSRITYQYEESGAVFAITYHMGSNGEWSVWEARRKAFNVLHLPTIDSYYMWDSENSTWRPNTEREYAYREDSICVMESNLGYSGGMYYGSKSEHDHDAYGRQTLIAEYSYTNGAWKGGNKWEYSYDSPTDKDPYITVYSEWHDGAWLSVTKYITKSDAYTDQTETYTWDGSVWNLFLRHTTLSRQFGDTILVTYDEHLQPDAYEYIGSRTEYEYDNDRHLLSKTYSKWDGQEWQPMELYTGTYDAAGNMTASTQRQYQSGVWYGTNETYRYERNLMVYGEYYLGAGYTLDAMSFELDQYVKCEYDDRGNLTFTENKIREQNGTIGLRHWERGAQNYLQYDDRDSVIRLENHQYDIQSRSFMPYALAEMEYGEVMTGYKRTKETDYKWNADSVRWEQLGTYRVWVDGYSEITESDIPDNVYKFRYDLIPLDGGTEEVHYQWWGGQWVPLNRKYVTCTDGRQCYQYDYYELLGGRSRWVGEEKWEHGYDEYGNLNYDLEYQFDLSEEKWFKGTEKEMKYNAKGELLQKITYYWNRSENRWVGLEHVGYDYDERGEQTMWATYDWDDIGLKWNPNMKTVFAYDEWGHTTMYGAYTGTSDGRWRGNHLWQNGYDADGNYILEQSFVWSDDAWDFVPTTKYEWTYGEDYYCHTRFEWKNGAWEMQVRDVEAKVYDADHNIESELTTYERLSGGELKFTDYILIQYKYSGESTEVGPVRVSPSSAFDEDAWYTPDGKRVAQPTAPGFYINRSGAKLLIP